MITQITEAAPIIPILAEAVTVAPTFSASFSVVITGIKTATINGLDGCVKEVSWVLKGEELGQTFELPQSTILPDAPVDNFMPLSSLTPEIVAGWVESDETKLIPIKAHIQFVLKKQAETASLSIVPMPWETKIIPDAKVENIT